MKLIDLFNVVNVEEQVTFFHAEEDTLLPELIGVAITEEGLKEFEAVMNAEVVNVCSYAGSLSVTVDEVKVSEMERFLNAATGNVSESLYNKWFELADDNEIINYEKDYVVKIISQEEMNNVIETRSPLGKFILIDGDKYVACDNSTGDAWTEDFKSLAEANHWLT